MNLDRYLRYLARYWYLLVALIIVAVLGTWIYLYYNNPAVAEATVAVLEPAVTRALDGQQAQINFASIAESRMVAERVVQRLNVPLTVGGLQGKVQVKLSRTLVPSVVTPLYIVQVEDMDPDLAIELTNAVVEEASHAFIELNQMDPTHIESALLPEEARIRSDLESARLKLRAFEEEHEVWRINAQIEAQLGLLTRLMEPERLSEVAEATRGELEQQLMEAEEELNRLRSLLPEFERLAFDTYLTAATVSDLNELKTYLESRGSRYLVSSQLVTALEEWDKALQALEEFQREETSSIGTTEVEDLPDESEGMNSALTSEILDLPAELATQNALVADLKLKLLALDIPEIGYERALAPVEAELNRLLSLLPEYEELATEVYQLQSMLYLLQARKVDLIISGSLSPAAQVKVLDPASIQSDFMRIFITYLLSVLFAATVGLSVVYLIGYLDRAPQTTSDVQELMGAPVLAQIPSAYGLRSRSRSWIQIMRTKSSQRIKKWNQNRTPSE
jgi:capsular polysaccharide biosynthesis protein